MVFERKREAMRDKKKSVPLKICSIMNYVHFFENGKGNILM